MAKRYTASETIEHTGTLPTTINGDGNALLKYRIYGASGGVGELTENLFSSVWEQGSINAETGQDELSSVRVRTEGYIEVIPNKIYSFSRNIYNSYMNVRFYSSDKSFIGVGSTSSIRLIAGGSEGNPMGIGVSFCCFEIIDTNVKYMRIADQSNNLATKYMMVEGEYTNKTMPSYEPYGYKLDMVISDGTSDITTPIYIGSDPLYENEYVDYQAGKVFRRTENLLSFEALMNAPSGKLVDTAIFPHALELVLKPYIRYTAVSDGIGSEYGTADINRSIYINNTNREACVFSEHPVTVQTGADGVVKIGILSERQNAQQYINGTAHVWLVEGTIPPETYIPYLQPTDPPVALPEIPTMGRNTVIDYSGTLKPSEIYIKYNSWSGWEDCVPRVLRVRADMFTSLPVTIVADGNNIRQYQIWGNVGGVGDRTVNWFDYRDYVAGYYISSSGVETEASHDSYFRATWLNHSDYISVSPDESYTISAHHQNMNTQQTVAIAWYDESKIFISRDSTTIPKQNAGSYSFTATAPQNAKFAIFNFFADNVQKVMFTPGTTPPETHVPFGYKVDIGVKSGNVYNTAETAWSADNTLLDDGGNPIASSSHYTTNFTAVKPETSYYLSGIYRMNSISSIRIYFYDESKCWISRSAKIDIGATRAFMTPANCEFIQIQIDTNIRSTVDWYIKEGTTPPDEYQPYINTTTPIYIGSDPLDEDEYVDYQAGKVYRRTAQLFDKSTVELYPLKSDGSLFPASAGVGWVHSDYIECHPGETYTAYKMSQGGANTYHCIYDENRTFVRSILVVANQNAEITFASGEKYIRLSVRDSRTAHEVETAMFFRGTSTPETDISYLQPADPALPTCNGTTIVDYDGIVKPIETYIKYNSWIGREDCVPRVLCVGTDTFTSLPAKIYTNDLSLGAVALDVSGNSIQNETPTPVTPVAVEGCGTLDNGRYKIPVTIGSQTQDIYLDTTTTTRRIKKMVLTGNETVLKNSNSTTDYLYYVLRGALLPSSKFQTPIVCSHLQGVGGAPQGTKTGINASNNYSVVYFNFGADVMNAQASGNTVDGLKEYLAAQYAAGTPVTVWYVLAEPETTTVNEPLMKIGNYVDTVSLNFTNVTPGEKEISVDTTVQPSSVVATHTGWHKQSELINRNDELTTPNAQQLSVSQSPLSSTPIENEEDEDIEETEEEGNEYELEH